MKRVYNVFCKVEEIAAGVGFFAIIALVFASAIARGIRFPINWATDMSLFLLAWVSFLGADCAFRYGQLIGIDILTRNFPANAQKIVQAVLFAAIIGALSVFTVFGVKLAVVGGARKFNSLPITYFYLYMSIPVASVSMVISAALKIRGIIADLRKTA